MGIAEVLCLLCAPPGVLLLHLCPEGHLPLKLLPVLLQTDVAGRGAAIPLVRIAIVAVLARVDNAVSASGPDDLGADFGQVPGIIRKVSVGWDIQQRGRIGRDVDRSVVSRVGRGEVDGDIGAIKTIEGNRVVGRDVGFGPSGVGAARCEDQ